VKGGLGAGANHQPVVLVPPGDADVGLDVNLLHLVDAVFVLKEVVGFGKPLLYIAVGHVKIVNEVVGGVVL
jgi:hypothetical protein